MRKRYKITVVIAEDFDYEQEVQLSHDNDKTNWYVSFISDYYAEFTFDTEHDAVNFYNSSKKTTNLYMDSLTDTTPKPEIPFEDTVIVASSNTNLEMTEEEIKAYEEGN